MKSSRSATYVCTLTTHDDYATIFKQRDAPSTDKASHVTAFCACSSPISRSPSTADEAWYWSKCVLRTTSFAEHLGLFFLG